MSRRALVLSILAVIAAVIVVAFLLRRAPSVVGRPLKPDADIKLTRPGAQCQKTSTFYEQFLRGSAGQQTQVTWRLANGCAPEEQVCMKDFTFEDGTPGSPFEESQYCNDPQGTGANRITARVRSGARPGIYYYSVYLGSTRIDPMIDIVP